MLKYIKIENLKPFENNPFKIKEDLNFTMLVESIAENGVINPILVRPSEKEFEVLSGQRRVIAAEIVGLKEVPAIVKVMSRDDAIVALVDSNLQREGLLPSEKAFAYKMKLEAIKRQGSREKSGQAGHKSRDEVSDSESGRQVQRYIRLTNLDKSLLDLVDENRIALTPAVELSYLPVERQRDIYETIESEESTPSLSQAIRMRELNEKGKLSIDSIFAILTEEKGNQIETLKVPVSNIKKYFSKDATNSEMQQTIIKALDEWYRRRNKNRDDYTR